MSRHSLSSSVSDQSDDENNLLPIYARLLATGEITWPEGLSPDETARLESMVREYRRKRLVALIASRIAAEVAEDAGQGG